MAISLEAVIRLRDEFSSKMKKATDKAKDFVKNAEGWKKAENNIKNVGGALTKYVTTPLAGVGTTAVMTVSSFDDSMSQVQAISGATGEEFEKLREMAKELGATTRFSASEAADGMTFLAMAGFDTQEVMATMPGLLDLAAASGMDLGRAADIASNVLSGFGLEAAEAGRVSDVLAAGASNANTSVEQLGDAMAVVAPVANTLGLDIEELTAAVGFMSDAGIQGSQAGRMLRQGLLRLASPTGEAADLIDELGINVFDAEGNMKSLDQVVAELENGLDGMSSQAQTAALSTLFGAESVAGWTAMLERGSGDLAEFTSELQRSEGAAANMAETMEDNIGGAFREMRSSIEGLLIAIGDELKPYVQDIAEVIGDWARKFTELDSSTKKIIISVGAFAAAIGPAAIALSTIISVGRNLITVFRGLAIAKGLFSAALWASPITWIIAGIVALIASGVWLVRNWDMVVEGLQNLWSWMKDVFSNIVEWVSEKLTQLGEFVSNSLDSVVNWFREKFELVKNFVIWYFTEYPYIVAEKMGELVGHAVNWLSQLPSRFREFFSSAYNTAVNWLSRLPGRAAEFLSDMVNRAKTRLSEFASSMKEWIKTAYDNAVNIVKELPGKIAGFIAEIPGRVRGFIGNVWSAFKEIGSAIPRAIADGFNAALGAVSGAAKWAINKVTSGLGGLRDLGGQVASSFARGFNSATDGSHYHGLDYVPRDGYRANLHRGEMVLPRQEAQAYREGRSGGGTSVNIHIARMEVRNETDIQRIGDALADRIESRLNRGTA